ncbi:MAG: DNA polymerase III subunit gamma/tau [Myxococcota bacterium]
MTYTVLARKYRPQTFEELVGQEHVARTLSNAITTDRVAHAFLFTGVRGVGKTSTARLLAKSLNCEHGPTPNPCNVCAACVAITQGVDVDVLEMDGASHNSVEDVRKLQETLPYRPARDRFKVVIIDEVHMLSTGAFNALLKTLEEPPPHVKFIFATTENHKVPITIRSRCQSYDFRLIPQAVIAQRVQEILLAEELQADEAALQIVAREAAGSMRDALTLLDQIVAFSGSTLMGDDVSRALGIASRTHVHDIARALLEGRPREIILGLDAISEKGVDILHFAKQLMQYCRDLVVLGLVEDRRGAVVDMVPEEQAGALELVSAVSSLELQRAFASLAKLVDEVGRVAEQRTVFEMGLVRIASQSPLKPLAELIERLEQLESRLTGSTVKGAAGGSGSGGNSSPGAHRNRDAHAPDSNKIRAAEPESRSAPAHSQPAAHPKPATRDTAAPALDSIESLMAFAEQKAAESQQPPSRPNAPRAASPDAASMPSEEDANAGINGTTFAGTTLAEAALTGATLAEATLTGAHDENAQDARQNTRSSETQEPKDSAPPPEWHAIVEHVAERMPPIGAILEHGVPLIVSAEQLQVGFGKGSLYAQQMEHEDAKEALKASASSVLGGDPSIEFVVASKERLRCTLAQERERRMQAEQQHLEQEALAHPLVLQAIDLFMPSAKVEVRIDQNRVSVESNR